MIPVVDADGVGDYGQDGLTYRLMRIGENEWALFQVVDSAVRA